MKFLQVNPDPRINFALCRLTKSSPGFWVFSAETLSQELEKVMVKYLEKHVDLKPTKKKSKTLFLPKILEWYAIPIIGMTLDT